jgi:hypothetical protein
LANTTDIPAGTAAKLIKITMRRLQQLVAEGWIKKTPGGQYTVVGTVHGYVDYLKDESRRRMRSTAQAELHSERAKILRLKRERLAGKLMLVAEHEAIIEESSGVYLTALSGLPAKISSDPKERNRVEDIIFAMRHELANKFQELANQVENEVAK